MKPALGRLGGLVRDLADFAYPPACPLCEEDPGRGPLCTDCELELVTLPGAVCSRCRLFLPGQGVCPLGHTSPPLRALGLFDHHYRALLHTFKFRGDLVLGRWLGRRLGRVLRAEGYHASFASVAAVPLHPVRLRERGFNQSAVLAREVARELEIPYREPLKRIRNTASQTRLDRARRRDNVHGAFAGLPGTTGSPVLLVDDVLTTGATVEGCGAALRAAGVEQFWAVTVALAEPPPTRQLAA